MKVRDLIKQLLDQDLDAEVGHVYEGRLYPLRTLVQVRDPNLRLGTNRLLAETSQLDVVTWRKKRAKNL